MSTIPKVIHQTWKNKKVVEYCRGLGRRSRKSLTQHYPDCQYKLWSDADILPLLEEPDFSPFSSLYLSQSKIKKTDIARYMILYKYGGLYFDLDCIMRERLSSIFDHELIGYKCFRRAASARCCSSRKKFLWPNEKGWILGNAFLGARPGHPIFLQALQSISDEKRNYFLKTTMKHTGPERLDFVCQEHNHWDSTHVLGHSDFGNSSAVSNHGSPRYGIHLQKHQW